MKEINVIVTMDCEPTLATTHGTATGPKDFALSERAIRGYFEIASSFGFPVTYFVHPETILAQADMFKELAAKGACIGLHMHPWKFSQWRHAGKRFMAHYGQLTYQDQVALLSEAATLWHEAMGERPMYFRPGTFSANDMTFRVLGDLGFRGGSVSAPGRVFNQIYAVWSGAEPDPHRACADFRMVAGSMNLGNMPLSADFSVLLEVGAGKKMHPDFRPDIDWQQRFGISYATIADNILKQVIERNPSIPTLNSISHNHYDYSDRSDPACVRYLTMLEAIAKACEKARVKTNGTTVGAIVEQTLKIEPKKESFVYF